MSQNLGTVSSPATRDISRSLTSIYKDFLGRGPTSTNTTFVGDMVVTVLEDSLTKGEHKLVETGRALTVRQMRRDFQDAMQTEIRAAVERHTGRRASRCSAITSPTGHGHRSGDPRAGGRGESTARADRSPGCGTAALPAILVLMAEELEGFPTEAQAPGGEPIAPAPADPTEGLPGPFAVGRYANGLRDDMRKRPRMRLIGEITGLRVTRKGVYFELRDADGAAPCAMWRDNWDRLKLPEGAVRDGAEVIVAGGPDYYPGSATASPSFSFRCTHLRLAGEGDLLAQLAILRRKLSDEGLFEPQARLPRPLLPRTIGIVTGRGSAAEADLIAGLARRGWAGRAIFAHPPVQDRHAAPRIGRALADLAAIPEVEVIIVARGGGSLTDLWAFCDETLCRTVALLRVPVISAVGHESDRTLIDDVAAVSCSTPTHATETAIGIDVAQAQRRLGAIGVTLARSGVRRGAGQGPPPRRLRPGARPPHRRPAPRPPPEDPRDPRLRPPRDRSGDPRQHDARDRPRPQARCRPARDRGAAP